MKEFYIELPSNASFSEFPHNSASNFTVRMPKILDLKGDKWDVALHSIQYPSIDIDVVDVHFKIIDFTYAPSRAERKKRSTERYAQAPRGKYNSADDVIEALIAALTPYQRSRFTLVVYDATVTLNVLNPMTYVIMSKQLVEIIGGREGLHPVGTYKHKPSLPRYNALHVYSDVVRPQHEGSELNLLLRVIPSKHTDPGVVYDSFK